METCQRCPPRLAAFLVVAACCGAAAAQSLDQLKGMIGGGGQAAAGGSSLPSLGQLGAGSAGNAAGVIEFCIRNNYLSGSGAASVKDRLLGKLSGGSQRAGRAHDDYASGARGLLSTGDGRSVDLSGGGLKAAVTKKVCEQVLGQAKSML